jgi:prepilin-type N-terminal cleavage/methylation domain-containing protein
MMGIKDAERCRSIKRRRKMNLKNNKSGFTLLEIIIVIIIVGVLASLALPRFFKTVEFSRSTEAINSLGSLRRAAEHCAMMGGAAAVYTNCTTFDQLGMDDPGASPNAHFAYTIDYSAPPAYVITATRNAVEGGDGLSTITFTLNTTTGALTKAGTLSFAGIK